MSEHESKNPAGGDRGAAAGPRPFAPRKPARIGPALDRLAGRLTQWLDDALDRAAERPRAAFLTLLVVALLAALPGLTSLPPTDRDESRFVQASRQMVETGDMVDIRFQDEPRWKKPAGIYWLQAASVEIASALTGADRSGAIWAYRAPSVLGALTAALGLAWAVGPLIGRRAATLAGMMLASAMILAAEATIAKTDAALLGISVLSMGAYARLLALSRADAGDVAAEDRRRLSLLFWAFIGFGALIKGPIVLIPPFGAALALSLVEKRLRPFAAMGWKWEPLLALALALPWYVAIAIRTEGAFFQEALVKDLVGKVVEGKESHGAPPGTYLAIFWGIFWPWAPFLIALAPALRAQIFRGPGLFLLAWAVPTWLVFELTPTKLPHYVLPALPPVAALIALALRDLWREPPGPAWRRWTAAVLSGLVGAALAVALVAGPAAVQLTHGLPLDPAQAMHAAVAGLAGGALSLAAARALSQGAPQRAVAPSLAAALAFIWGALGAGLPALRYGFPSVDMAAAAAPVARCTGHIPGALTYREPSLVFLQGRATPTWTEAEAAAALSARDGATAWVEDRRRDRFDAAAQGLAVRELASVLAFNPNRGKPTVIRLLAAADDPVVAACPR